MNVLIALVVLAPIILMVWLAYQNFTKFPRIFENLWRLQNDLNSMRTGYEKRIKQLEEELSALKASPGQTREEPRREAPKKEPVPDLAPLTAAIETPRASKVPVFEPEPEAEPLEETIPPSPTKETAREPREEFVPPSKTTRLIDLERLIGVRGAALLGGIVLAIAGLLFLRYSIEQGLIPPIMRVTLTIVAGLACVGGSEVLRKREYTSLANALSGAGFVLLYGAVWAARVLYDLIGTGPAFGLIALTTVSCGVLSWKKSSVVVASIGLAGGFAAPYMLSSNSDNPIGLFGYLLILDAGVLLLARARKWPALAFACMAATAVYEAGWIFTRMGQGNLILGLGILGLFFLLFLFAKRRLPFEEGDVYTHLMNAVTLLVPCLLGFRFALQTDADMPVYLLGAFLFVVMMGALWMGSVHGLPVFGLLASVFCAANVLAWTAKNQLTPTLSWQVFGVAAALALGSHLAAELRRDEGEERAYPALALAGCFAVGFYWLTPKGGAEFFWPWILTFVVLCASVYRLGSVIRRPMFFAAGPVGLGLAFFILPMAHNGNLPYPSAFYAAAIAFGAALLFPTFRFGQDADRKWAGGASALFSLIVLTTLIWAGQNPQVTPAYFFGASILLGVLSMLSSTRMPSGAWFFAAVATLSAVHGAWAIPHPGPSSDAAFIGFIAMLFCVALFTFWPFIVGRAFLADPYTRYGAALAAPFWFLSLRSVFTTGYGDGFIGVLPLGLGAVSLAAAYRSKTVFDGEPLMQRSYLAWFAGCALAFISVAIPMQLSNEWVTVGWAIEGFATIYLWKKLDHPGLKAFGMALLLAVTARLIANPWIFEYHPRSYWPVVNWLLYTYGISAAAMLGSFNVLKDLEVERRSEGEKNLYNGKHPMAAYLCGLSALLVIFVWINLTIFDAFSSQPKLAISLDHLPARDLTLSLAWAVYALLLLSIGVMKNIGGLRWVSLAFFFVTISKVFLYDLGELNDLYRVASLVGLAFSLIIVSLAYQRFVFKKTPAAQDQ